MSPTIVVVEDDPDFCESYRKILEAEDYEVVCLSTFVEAYSFLHLLLESHDGHDHVKAMMFDYILDPHNQEVKSLPLIRKVKSKGFKGIMLANATEVSFMEQQMQVGCTHKLEDGFEKHEAARYLLKLLQEQ